MMYVESKPPEYVEYDISLSVFRSYRDPLGPTGVSGRSMSGGAFYYSTSAVFLSLNTG